MKKCKGCGKEKELIEFVSFKPESRCSLCRDRMKKYRNKRESAPIFYYFENNVLISKTCDRCKKDRSIENYTSEFLRGEMGTCSICRNRIQNTNRQVGRTKEQKR